MRQFLELNFGRGCIEKLIEDFVKRASRLHIREAKSYLIEIDIRGMVATLRPLREALIRRIEVTRRATSWNDLVDAINIKVFLIVNKDFKN